VDGRPKRTVKSSRQPRTWACYAWRSTRNCATRPPARDPRFNARPYLAARPVLQLRATSLVEQSCVQRTESPDFFCRRRMRTEAAYFRNRSPPEPRPGGPPVALRRTWGAWPREAKCCRQRPASAPASSTVATSRMRESNTSPCSKEGPAFKSSRDGQPRQRCRAAGRGRPKRCRVTTGLRPSQPTYTPSRRTARADLSTFENNSRCRGHEENALPGSYTFSRCSAPWPAQVCPPAPRPRAVQPSNPSMPVMQDPRSRAAGRGTLRSTRAAGFDNCGS